MSEQIDRDFIAVQTQEIKELREENKALRESRDEFLGFLKGIQGELPKYHRSTSGELIKKVEQQKEQETK